MANSCDLFRVYLEPGSLSPESAATIPRPTMMPPLKYLPPRRIIDERDSSTEAELAVSAYIVSVMAAMPTNSVPSTIGLKNGMRPSGHELWQKRREEKRCFLGLTEQR